MKGKKRNYQVLKSLKEAVFVLLVLSVAFLLYQNYSPVLDAKLQTWLPGADSGKTGTTVQQAVEDDDFVPFDVEKYHSQNPVSEDKTEIITQKSSSSVDEEKNTRSDTPGGNPLLVGGWIPQWDYTAGVQSVKRYSFINLVSPVWYHVNNNGDLIISRPGTYKELLNLKDDRNISIVPTVSLFDADTMHSVLDSDVNMTRHINSIVYEVDAYGYDGIDLDYEQIYLQDKENYFVMLDALANKLHRKDKILSVTVLPKWGRVSYSSSPETRQVQDWARVAEIADYVRVMAYDYTNTADPDPGPVSPTGWLTKIMDYAKDRIPADKLIIGLPLYAYEWGTDGRRASYTYTQVADILGEQTEQSYIASTGESMSIYECGNHIQCTMYFQSKESVSDHFDLVTSYDIAGVVYWRLGGDGTLLDVLREYNLQR